MVLTLQQQKFKVMLEEAITLLCRSSLPYKCEASIEALIGITVDCDDVFLISIKEKFDNKIPTMSLDLCSEDSMFENSSSDSNGKEQSVELQNDGLDVVENNELSEPKSKKRKRDIDKIACSEDEFHYIADSVESPCDDIVIHDTEPENANRTEPTMAVAPAEPNLSNLICGDITEIKSEKLYENFLNNCFSIPEESSRFRFNNAGCHVFSDYNSRINVRVEKVRLCYLFLNQSLQKPVINFLFG